MQADSSKPDPPTAHTSNRGLRMSEHFWIKSYPEGVRWDAPLPRMPVAQILDEAVARWPTLPCRSNASEGLFRGPVPSQPCREGRRQQRLRPSNAAS